MVSRNLGKFLQIVFQNFQIVELSRVIQITCYRYKLFANGVTDIRLLSRYLRKMQRIICYLDKILQTFELPTYAKSSQKISANCRETDVQITCYPDKIFNFFPSKNFVEITSYSSRCHDNFQLFSPTCRVTPSR